MSFGRPMKDPDRGQVSAPSDSGPPLPIDVAINQTAGPNKRGDKSNKGDKPCHVLTDVHPNMSVDLLLASQDKTRRTKEDGSARLEKAIVRQRLNQQALANGVFNKKAAAAQGESNEGPSQTQSSAPTGGFGHSGTGGASGLPGGVGPKYIAGGRSAPHQSRAPSSISKSLPNLGDKKNGGGLGMTATASYKVAGFMGKLMQDFGIGAAHAGRKAQLAAAQTGLEAAETVIRANTTQRINAAHAIGEVESSIANLQRQLGFGTKTMKGVDPLTPRVDPNGALGRSLRQRIVGPYARDLSEQTALRRAAETNISHATESVKEHTQTINTLGDALGDVAERRTAAGFTGLGLAGGGAYLGLKDPEPEEPERNSLLNYLGIGKEGSAPDGFDRHMQAKFANYYQQVRPQEVLGEMNAPDQILAGVGALGGAGIGYGAAGLGAERAGRAQAAPIIEMMRQGAAGDEAVMGVARQEAKSLGQKLPRYLSGASHVDAEAGRLERALMKAIKRKRMLPLLALGGIGGLTAAGHYRRAAGSDRDPFNAGYPQVYGGR